MEFSTNRVRSLMFNSNDWGVNANYIEVLLDYPIVGASKYKIRKVVMPNVIFQFIAGINDSFYICFQNQPEIIIKVPVPTNQVLYTFDMFATFIQTALNAVDASDSWTVSYNMSINRLMISNGSSRAFKILTVEDLNYINQPYDNTLINYNLGIDDTVNTFKEPNSNFSSTQTLPNNPIVNPTEVYINSSICNNNNLALPYGESRRDCLLIMPLVKAFNGICVYNAKSDDWVNFASDTTISQFSVSITDRYGRFINLGLPYTIQFDFAY